MAVIKSPKVLFIGRNGDVGFIFGSSYACRSDDENKIHNITGAAKHAVPPRRPAGSGALRHKCHHKNVA